MHIAAQRNDPGDFASWRQHVGLKICEMQQMHDSLIRVYPTTYDGQRFYYSTPMPYLIRASFTQGVGFTVFGASPAGVQQVGADFQWRCQFTKQLVQAYI